MRFRNIQENTTWVVFKTIVDHNYRLLSNDILPNRTIRYYAKLLSICPLSDKEEDIFFKLDNYKKVGFLSRYLIKCCRKSGISNSIIKVYLRLKNDYHKSKGLKLSEGEYKDRLKIYLIDKNYESLLSMYFENGVVYDKYSKFNDFGIMLINILLDNHIDKIRINTKQRLINMEPFTEGRKRRKTINHIREEFSYVSDDVLDIEDRIEMEVRNRVKKELNKKNKKATPIIKVSDFTKKG